MITIKSSTETSLVIKKSRFLGLACRADSEQAALDCIEQRRKQHYDATHHCFAFVLENGVMRYSDDGEPQGTAGLPMLEVLKKSGVSDVLVVCTRYFGGTLLGAGGLVRAYTQSAADTLGAAQKVALIPCSVFMCAFPYAVWAKAEKPLCEAGYAPDDIRYSDDVQVTFSVSGGSEAAFMHLIASISLGKTTPVPVGQRLAERPIG